MRALVTGGAGFIGSALVRHLVAQGAEQVVVFDALTYAASPTGLGAVAGAPGYRFVRGDIADRTLVAALLSAHRIDTVFHLAAETHVDRSIAAPAVFIETNIVGTFHLLEGVRDYLATLPADDSQRFRFVHVSTDEVHGDLTPSDPPFDEDAAYRPSSPYAASKAAADHLVSAWARTYRLPVLLTHCSNNFGPYQSLDKLIPRAIVAALSGDAIPVFGTGANIRDWLYVDDHVAALALVAARAGPGSRYAIGGRSERSVLSVVQAICDRLDALAPRPDRASYRQQIVFVADRAGHDLRYAIDPSRIERDLGWRAVQSFETGLDRTVAWYVESGAGGGVNRAPVAPRPVGR